MNITSHTSPASADINQTPKKLSSTNQITDQSQAEPTSNNSRGGESIHIDISSEAKQKLAQEQAKTKESASPQATVIKELEARIEEIKEKIEKKKEQIAAIKNDNTLSEEAKKKQLEQLAGELTNLTAQLTITTASLLEAKKKQQQN